MEIDLSKYNLENWEEVSSGNKEGGQASIVFLKNKQDAKQQGVFRLLKSDKDDDRKRFIRELRILTNPQFYHNNIISILQHSEEEYWYITPKGMPFDTYWKRKVEREKDVNKLLQICLSYIKMLAGGLEKLHEATVIHRDIKHQNIVVIEDVPKLIDFGLAYNDREERISHKDDIAGNRRYSPDKAIYYLNNPVPWLDVFQLSQLLIWMMCNEPLKNLSWQRPLAWEWVLYPKKLNQEYESRLRAITALCSEERLSPQNATEFIQLINRYFPMEKEENKTQIDLPNIHNKILSSLSVEEKNDVEFFRIVNAAIPSAEILFNNFFQFFDEINNSLIKSSILKVVSSGKSDLRSWFKKVLDEKKDHDSTQGERITVEFNSKEILIIDFLLRSYSPLTESFSNLAKKVYPEGGEFIFQVQLILLFKKTGKRFDMFINQLHEDNLGVKIFSGEACIYDGGLKMLEIKENFYKILNDDNWNND